MALQRITHTGAAPPTGLASPISASALSLTLLSGTGYPTGAGGPFVIDVDAATPSEEKILCLSLSGSTITVAPGGRGFDGTAPAAHNGGTNNVTHVITSAEADDANAHIYVPTRDDHTQYVRTDGSRSVTGSLTIAGGLNVGGAATAASVAAGTLQANAGGPILGPVRLVGSMYGGAPASGTWNSGDVIGDTYNGTLWVCTVGGTPGTWAKVGAAGAATGAVLLAYIGGSPPALPSGITTPVPYNTVIADPWGAWNTSTFTFTAPANGLYRVYAQCAVAAGVSTLQLGNFIGGSLGAAGLPGYSGTDDFGAVTQFYACVQRTHGLTAGATLRVSALSTSAAPTSWDADGNRSYLEIEQLH